MHLPISLPIRVWLPNQLIVYPPARLLDWLTDWLTDHSAYLPNCGFELVWLLAAGRRTGPGRGYHTASTSTSTLFPRLRTCCGFQLPFDRTSLLLMLTKTETKIRDVAGGHTATNHNKRQANEQQQQLQLQQQQQQQHFYCHLPCFILTIYGGNVTTCFQLGRRRRSRRCRCPGQIERG